MTIPERLRHNLALKFLSLAIALVIWGTVHNQADPMVVRHRAVRVEAVSVPSSLAVTAIDPEQVTVTLFGRASAFDQLEYSNFRLTANVAGAEVGERTTAVEAQGLPAGLEIRQMSRAMVRVALDTVVSATRPVFVETEGRPAAAAAAVGTEVKPDSVQVIGPSSEVQKVARVVAQVDVSGRTATMTTTVALVAREAGNLAMSSVRMEPSQASVTVQIKQVNSKTVPVVPVISSVPAGYEVSRIVVRPLTVTLAGPGAVLTGTDAVQTAPVNLQGARDHAEFTVPVRLPDGAHTVGAASVTVSVDLRRARARGEQAPPQAAPPPATAPSSEKLPPSTEPEDSPPAAPPAVPAPPAAAPDRPGPASATLGHGGRATHPDAPKSAPTQ